MDSGVSARSASKQLGPGVFGKSGEAPGLRFSNRRFSRSDEVELFAFFPFFGLPLVFAVGLMHWSAWFLWLVAILCALAVAWPVFCSLRWVVGVSVPRDAVSGRVVLVLPYAPPGELAPLIACLESQTLLAQRLIISVEKTEDLPPVPATAFRVDFVVAGPARDRAQKCHNQLAALASLDGTESAVVFLDADIRPSPWWLASLCAPVLEHRKQVVGGYRWLVPSMTVDAQIVAWLDRTWSLIPKIPAFRLLWGGSMALSPSSLPVFREAVARGVTDDLTFARMAVLRGLSLLVRGGILSPTEISSGAFGFWTRQLKLMRFHHPVLWFVQFLTSHIVIGLWVVGIFCGYLWIPAILAGIGFFRVVTNAIVSQRIARADSAGIFLAQAAVGVLPVAEICSACCLWKSAIGRTFTWRGKRYHVNQSMETTTSGIS